MPPVCPLDRLPRRAGTSLTPSADQASAREALDREGVDSGVGVL